jgi:hypothetical protein
VFIVIFSCGFAGTPHRANREISGYVAKKTRNGAGFESRGQKYERDHEPAAASSDDFQM